MSVISHSVMVSYSHGSVTISCVAVSVLCVLPFWFVAVLTSYLFLMDSFAIHLCIYKLCSCIELNTYIVEILFVFINKYPIKANTPQLPFLQITNATYT